MKALLNYARMDDASASELSAGLRRLGIVVTSTMSYRGEAPERFGPDVVGYWWRDYRPEAAAVSWGDSRPESLLSGEELLALLPATERPGPHQGGSIEAYWRLRADLVRAERILDEAQPEVILFVDHPENSLDFLVLRLAAARGIAMVVNRMGVSPNSRVVMRDAFEPTLTPEGALSGSVIPCREDSPVELEGRARARAIREARLQGEDIWRWGGDALPDIPEQPRIARIRRKIEGRSRRIRMRRVERPLVTGRRFVAQLASDLAASASGAAPESGRTDCVLMLHYQPEMTTLTLGGWAVNQLEAVKLLADGLPDGWRLFVREHPMLLSGSRSKVSATFRPPGFYARIAAMPRTHLMPLSGAAPVDLRTASMIATATGTVGLEALALGIPVIHFGLAPYTNFPGTARIASPSIGAVGPEVARLRGMAGPSIVEGFRRSSEAVEEVSFHQGSGSFTAENARVLLRGVAAWLG